MIATALFGAGLIPHVALAASPALVIATGPAIDPDSALSYYGDPASPTPGARDVMVKEIARSLRYDVDRIFTHVRDNVEVVPLFGLTKGARGVVLDGYGTPFDQAQFMVDALREADQVMSTGYSPQYVVGKITLGASDFSSWTGVGDAASAAKLLASGGIPATVTGSGTSFSVTMLHIWVRATIGGTNYVFDPSYKPHTARAGIAWKAAMGYSRSALLASGGGTNTSSSTSGFNGPAYDTTLTGYRQNVENYVAANAAGKRADAVVGTTDIVPHAASENRRAALPYAVSSDRTWIDQIPNIFRSAFSVALNGTAYGTYYADEVGEAALQFSYSASGSTFAPDNGGQGIPVVLGNFDGACEGYLNSSPAGPAQVGVTINHPYAANGGTYLDRTITRSVANRQCASGLFFVTNDWGYTGSGYSERIRPAASALGSAAPPAISFAIAPTLANVASQYSAFLDLAGRVQSNVYLTHDLVGVHTIDRVKMALISGQTQYDSHTMLSMDFEGAVTAFSKSGTTADDIGAAYTAGFGLAYAEGAVPRQEADAVYDMAAINLVTQASTRAISNSNTTLYLSSPSSWSSVQGNLTNYSSSALSTMGAYSNEGYLMLAPRPGNLRQPQITVGARTSALNEGGDLFIGPEVSRSSFLAVRQGVGGIPDRFGLVLYDPRRGSIIKAGVGIAFASGAGALRRPDAPKAESKDLIRSELSVDPRTGAQKFAPSADLVDGIGEFPRSLTLQRAFDSRDLTNYGLGQGWKTNWYQAASLSNDGQGALGRAGAGGIASALVAITAIADLAQVQDPVSLYAATRATAWLADQTMNNTITVSRGFDSEQQFYRQANGNYIANDIDGSTLAFSGTVGTGIVNRRIYAATAVSYFDNAGTTRTYVSAAGGSGYDMSSPAISSLFTRKTIYLTNWTFPSGVKITANYENNGLTPDIFRLERVSSTLGNSIRITSNDPGSYTPFPYCDRPGGVVKYGPESSASLTYGTSSGRSISYNMEAQVGYTVVGDPDTARCPTGSTTPPTIKSQRITSVLNTFVDAGAASWNYGYAPAPGLFGPNAIPGYVMLTKLYKPTSATADIEVTLGLDGNVRSMTDTRGKSWYYFSSAWRSEAMSPLQAQAGIGSVTLFDRYARPTVSTDPLGRQSLTEYDDFGRAFRTTSPELDSVIREYDVRGNLITETRKAKYGSALADLVTRTAYVTGPAVADCAGSVVCNEPSYAIDARGTRTSYAWDAATGNVASVTMGLNGAGTSCLVSGGTCPMTTFGYTGFTGTDPLNLGTTTIYLPTSKTDRINATQTTSTTLGYDTANRLYPREQVVDSGGLALRTCYKFDAAGNLQSVTEPKGTSATCP